MGLLHKIFRIAEPEERAGIELGNNPANWRVDSVSDAALFFSAVSELVDEESIIALHDPLGEDVVEFAISHAAKNKTKVAVGTIWPRSKIHHIKCTKENLLHLQDLAQRHAQPEIAIHIHVYKAGQVILEWYDAFDDPIYLAPTIAESDVEKFATKCEGSYEVNAT